MSTIGSNEDNLKSDNTHKINITVIGNTTARSNLFTSTMSLELSL